MAFRGLGKFINVANEIKVNAAILLLGEKKVTVNFLILCYHFSTVSDYRCAFKENL